MRLALETALTFTLVTGRTLVIPPTLSKMAHMKGRNVQPLSFFDEQWQREIPSITFDEFLRVHVFGKKILGTAFDPPPDNRTNWDNLLDHSAAISSGLDVFPLWKWWRKTVEDADQALWLNWHHKECIGWLPTPHGECTDGWRSPTRTDTARAIRHMAQYTSRKSGISGWLSGLLSKLYTQKSLPINPTVEDRLEHVLANRSKACIYDQRHQEARVIHLSGEDSSVRFFVPFYAFVFPEDWNQDRFIKRWVRDSLKYSPQVFNAAQAIVNQLHKDCSTFNSIHVRRNDFSTAYPMFSIGSAEDYYRSTLKNVLEEASVVFVATDEENKTWYDPIREHYNLFFLDDFKDLLHLVRIDEYAMVEQLVCSRGDSFVGVYGSTLSSYIMRLRGYRGQTKSFYHCGESKRQSCKNAMQDYHKVSQFPFVREFPLAWENIDS